MLTPTSLSGLSIGADFLRPVRSNSPAQGAAPGDPRPTPLSPSQFGAPGQPEGGSPVRTLPRGSLLDLSV